MLWACVVSGAVAFFIYSNTLDFGFVYDDNYRTTVFVLTQASFGSIRLDSLVVNVRPEKEDFTKTIVTFYETSLQYLEQWTTHFEDLEMFEWATLKKNPEWSDVQLAVDYLIDKKHFDASSDTELFDEMTCLVNALVVLSSTAEDGEIEVRISVGRAILSNDDVLPETPLSELWLHDFWGTPLRHSGSHGSYRPLTTLSFKLNAVWAGGDLRAASSSKGFHVVNVILHSATTAAFTWWIGLLPSSHARLMQWLSGLLFAVHPVHTEAVSGIVGRADVGAALFFLLALLAYKAHLHHRDKRSGFVQMMYLVLCLLSALCSMLTKEHGVTVLLVCVLYEMLFNTRHTPTQVLQHLLKRPCRCDQNDCQDSKKIQEWSSRCLIVSFCIFICARACLAGGHFPRFSTADNPASRSESFLTRTLTFLYLPVFNFLLLLCPTTLSFDWSMDAIPLITSIIDRRNLSILTFYCAFIVVVFRNIKCLNVNKPVIAFDTIVKRTTVDVNENNDYQVNSEWLKATNNLQDPSKYKDAQTYHSSTNQTHFKQYHRTCNLIKNNSTHLAHRRCNFNQCSCETTVHNLDTSIAIKMSKKRNDSKVILMAIILLVVPFLPATNLVAYVGFVVAERVLYISSMGHSLLVGHGLSRLIAWSVGRRVKWQQFLVIIFTAVLLVVFGSKTWLRNFDWCDEESLYRSGLDVNPPKEESYCRTSSVFKKRFTATELLFSVDQD
uniref:(California timema) hypothetical protein n=1 Tax=Timema californicum TaxID=61474 RepID=A0A7R9P2W6_TIMCA|nr:unnamed protein product [Timema californicum]